MLEVETGDTFVLGIFFYYSDYKCYSEGLYNDQGKEPFDCYGDKKLCYEADCHGKGLLIVLYE
jgi:hypothetical protein